MSIYDYSARLINGTKQSLAAYKGQVVLIVNTASRCGFTPQYSGLEKLYQTYKDRGFVVLGFPCNQFMNQEPGSEEEILSFCQTNYQVSFPMFAKVKVKGPEAHPLFQYLTSQAKGILSDEIKWNFTKFLADKNGQVVKRYAPTTAPEKIAPDIERLLEEKGR
ncbi:glutathione peroxidase [Caldalkalibacillus thermarum]|uniref:glutathione peroxidase n=1 Tax=Caldalkalibacillus thermarum TaxID=296745 RepID=UPI0016664CDE|nr:glutathione peroxidase [Caldalkalibacillus thermarum]GGK28445.1 glutathione peroxidase [Caldalkalibacillus thermarum]